MSAVLERNAVPVLSEEDRARAEHYAVLSRLFAAPADAEFLAMLSGFVRNFGSSQSALGQAWLVLGDAAHAATPEDLEEEYTRLFLSIGRPEVMLFGSFYLAGCGNASACRIPFAGRQADDPRIRFRSPA